MSNYAPPWGHREAQVRDALKRGIATLRDAADEAERRLNQSNVDDAVQYVPKVAIWGLANASSLFETAQMWHNTGNAERIMMLEQEILRLRGEA